jgi:predicted alpha/beta hydrolase family esterase
MQKNKKIQVLIIHGGMTFKNKKDYLQWLKTREISIEQEKNWSNEYLRKELGKNFQIIKPRMPLADNAHYDEWKIHFERHFPYLKDNVILIGNSLGGIFLAKYLSENKFPRKILSTYLVCPPFRHPLPTEDLVGGFGLKPNLSLLEKNSPDLTLMFSKDDDVVPVSHAREYQKKLKSAKVIIYKSKNSHFQIARFPEIIRMIKKRCNDENMLKR